jgi:hypothetical protein
MGSDEPRQPAESEPSFIYLDSNVYSTMCDDVRDYDAVVSYVNRVRLTVMVSTTLLAEKHQANRQHVKIARFWRAVGARLMEPDDYFQVVGWRGRGPHGPFVARERSAGRRAIPQEPRELRAGPGDEDLYGAPAERLYGPLDHRTRYQGRVPTASEHSSPPTAPSGAVFPLIAHAASSSGSTISGRGSPRSCPISAIAATRRSFHIAPKS